MTVKETVLNDEISKVEDIRNIERQIDVFYGMAVASASDQDGLLVKERILQSVFTVANNESQRQGVDGSEAVAGMLEMFKDDGLLRGTISIGKRRDNDKVHSWVRYTAFNGKNIIIDTENNLIGMLADPRNEPDIAKLQWSYLTDDEKRNIVSEQARIFLDGEVEENNRIEHNEVDKVMEIAVTQRAA